MKCDRCKQQIPNDGWEHILNVDVGCYNTQHVRENQLRIVANDLRLCTDCFDSFIVKFEEWRVGN